MNNDQLQACWNELKLSASAESEADPNPRIEKMMRREMTVLGPRRRFWKKTAVVASCLLGLCIIGGLVADNIVMATTVRQPDGSQQEESVSLLDLLKHHIHAHAKQIHKHFHGE
jgi:hypothetical protein